MRTPQTSVVHLLTKLIGQQAPPVEASQSTHESRRTFIRQLSVAAAGTALSGNFLACHSIRKPTIAIVGAGMAGLTAAYYLEKAGLRATLFEAGNRVGGRVWSAKNLLADGIVTELGGEFINSGHADMLALCQELNLPLLDTRNSTEKTLITMGFFFAGRRISEHDIIQAFAPFTARIRQDIAGLTHLTMPGRPVGKQLDSLSIDAYLHEIGISGWLHTLISTSFTSEYGLAAGDQSCLNLLIMLNPDTTKGFEIYGDSDERYKVIGGNERIPAELHKRLKSTVQTGCHLERIAAKGTGYQLSFANGHDTNADLVIMAVPFTVLRTVQFNVAMSDRKRRCIQELGYGTSSKLLIGVDDRIWRRAGYTGYAFSDVIHNGWDSSQMQHNNTGPGGYSLLLGGERGRTLAMNQFDQYLDGCEQVFPGMKQATNGRKHLYNWSKNPLAHGSYSCYRVGQATTLSGAERERVGTIFFAGEHCSRQFQGFMNGAAETGRRAAEDVTTLLATAAPVSVRG